MTKIGLVGCGSIGAVHYGAYCKLKGVKIAAVCDLDPLRAENMLQGKPVTGNIPGKKVKPNSFNPAEAAVYTSLDEMLRDPEIDIVDICLPTFLHKEAVIKSAKAKKDILCEKPLALNLKDADQMLAAVKKNKVKFMVAHVIRFWPEYVVLTEYITKQALGKLLELNLQRHSPAPVWSD